jgi:hypothetical protein
MASSRFLLYRLSAVTALGIAASMWIWTSVAARQSGSAERKPFTFYFVETSSSRTGTSASREMFRAERTDGSVSYGLVGEVSPRRIVVNRSEMWRAELSDTERLKSTYAAPLARRRTVEAKMPAVPEDCGLSSTDQGRIVERETILGYETYHYEKVTQQDGQTLEDHTWFSPGLGCYDVKRLVYRRDAATGEVMATFERRPLRVIIGEPEDRLFAVPPDYREVAPSELDMAQLQSRVKAERGAEAAEQLVIPPSVAKSLQVKDKEYWRDRK